MFHVYNSAYQRDYSHGVYKCVRLGDFFRALGLFFFFRALGLEYVPDNVLCVTGTIKSHARSRLRAVSRDAALFKRSIVRGQRLSTPRVSNFLERLLRIFTSSSTKSFTRPDWLLHDSSRYPYRTEGGDPRVLSTSHQLIQVIKKHRLAQPSGVMAD